MATRFQIAIQQGAVDVTNLRNEVRFRTSPGFRVVAKPRGISAFGSQDALNRAVARAKRTGVFPASQFLGIFRVSNIGAFTPGVPTGVGGRPLTKASIRGLEKVGILKPRFETRAGIAVKKVETPAQKSFRLARERRVSRTFGRVVPSVGKLRAQELERARQFFREKGGPFAIGVTKEQLGSPFLREFNVLFARKTLKPVTLNVISRKLDIEGKKLDKRIANETATQAQVNKFNALVTHFNIQVGRSEAKQLRKFFKERPSPLKPLKVEPPKPISSDLTLSETIPKELGGKGISFVDSATDFGKLLGKTVPPRASPAVKRRITNIGQIFGGLFALLDTAQKFVVFGAQEDFKRRLKSPTGIQFSIPKRLSPLFNQVRSTDLIVLTNPLNFVKTGKSSFVLTPRAFGETAGFGFDIALLFIGGTARGTGKVVQVSRKTGLIQRILGSFRKQSVAPTISDFSKIKLKDAIIGKRIIGQIIPSKKFTRKFRVPVELRFPRKPKKFIGKIPVTIRPRVPRLTAKVGVTDLTKLSDKQLVKEINAFIGLEKTRKVAGLKPGKIQQLQTEIFKLRELFAPQKLTKPLSSNLNKLKKELRELEALQELSKTRKTLGGIKGRLKELQTKLPSKNLLNKKINRFFRESIGRKITGVFRTERETERLKKLIRQATTLEKRAKRFPGEKLFPQSRVLKNTIFDIERFAKKTGTPLVLKDGKIVFIGKFRVPITVKQHLNLLKLLKAKVRKVILKPKRAPKRVKLEAELFDVRARIDGLLGTKRDLLVKKPVPRDLRKLQSLVTRTKQRLKKIEFELDEVSRVSKQKKGVRNEILKLKSELQFNVTKSLPLSLKDLRKLLKRLRNIKATRKFKVVSKNIRQKRVQQLALLREKNQLFRLSKRKVLTNIEVKRFNSLTKRIGGLGKDITRGKPKPTRVIRGRVIQIQKVKLKKVKKRIKKLKPKITKIQLPISETKPGFRFSSRQQTFDDVIEEFYTFPRQVPSGISNRSQGFLVRQFRDLIVSPGLRLSVLTIADLRKFALTTGILRLLLRARFSLSRKLLLSLRSRVNSLAKLKVEAALKSGFKLAERLRIREKVRLVSVTLLKKKPVKPKIIRKPLRFRKPPKRPVRKPPKKPPKRPPKKPPRRSPLIIPLPGIAPVSVETIVRSKGPFNVIVRSRGKKIRINKFPLTGSQALGLGGHFADNNAVRSFAIIKTKGRTRKVAVGRFNKNKFRRPVGNTKLERFFLVEKTAFAIDTPGEKRQISRRGIRTSRRKKKRRVKRRIRRRVRRTIRRRKR